MFFLFNALIFHSQFSEIGGGSGFQQLYTFILNHIFRYLTKSRRKTVTIVLQMKTTVNRI